MKKWRFEASCFEPREGYIDKSTNPIVSDDGRWLDEMIWPPGQFLAWKDGSVEIDYCTLGIGSKHWIMKFSKNINLELETKWVIKSYVYVTLIMFPKFPVSSHLWSWVLNKLIFKLSDIDPMETILTCEIIGWLSQLKYIFGMTWNSHLDWFDHIVIL
jgi:hypothetical protein